jgi:hypothetical protein
MEQSPSWEASRFVASQEIPRVLLNPKVRCRIYKYPPPVSILSQPNPVHTPTSHFLKIHPNIILPSTSGSPQWSFSLRFPHQNPIGGPPCRLSATAYSIYSQLPSIGTAECLLKIVTVSNSNILWKLEWINEWIIAWNNYINEKCERLITSLPF